MKNVADALSGKWINQCDIDQLEDFEKELFKDMTVIYMTDKGNHLVPVWVYKDCISGLKLLMDVEVRKQAGVLESNVYVFANTEQSPYHVLGWDAIHKMCINSQVDRPDLRTASKQRHRISNIYASLEVTDTDHDFFISTWAIPKV